MFLLSHSASSEEEVGEPLEFEIALSHSVALLIILTVYKEF